MLKFELIFFFKVKSPQDQILQGILSFVVA